MRPVCTRCRARRCSRPTPRNWRSHCTVSPPTSRPILPARRSSSLDRRRPPSGWAERPPGAPRPPARSGATRAGVQDWGSPAPVTSAPESPRGCWPGGQSPTRPPPGPRTCTGGPGNGWPRRSASSGSSPASCPRRSPGCRRRSSSDRSCTGLAMVVSAPGEETTGPGRCSQCRPWMRRRSQRYTDDAVRRGSRAWAMREVRFLPTAPRRPSHRLGQAHGPIATAGARCGNIRRPAPELVATSCGAADNAWTAMPVFRAAFPCARAGRRDTAGSPRCTPARPTVGRGATMSERTTCVVIGGGPAGMVLGLLLARAGVEVTVLEKHADFLRDFRADTVHPSTLQLLDELGLAGRFAKLPYSRLDEVAFPIDADRSVVIADFRRLHVPYPYIAMVPQWDLVNLLAAAAQDEPSFSLRMRTEVTGLIREAGQVRGVRYRTDDGTSGEIRADLTVACDGRWSIARRQADLPLEEFPVPIDAWWFRLPRRPTDQTSALTPRAGKGRFAVVIPRDDYLQIAYIARKGTDRQLRARGIERFRQDIAELMPELADRVDALASMDDVKHLDVRLNRLDRWHADGLLCIGDAAHAMSPVGGVGINLAVQDAVAAASLLAGPLRRRGAVTPTRLAAVRARRILPTVLVQSLQRILHRNLVVPIVEGRRMGPPKPVLALLGRVPQVSLVPAYLIGVGLRPQHAPDFARRRPEDSA